MNQPEKNQLEYIKASNLILANKGKTFYWAKFLLNKEHATKAGFIDSVDMWMMLPMKQQIQLSRQCYLTISLTP
jgi:hypothetical protein